MARFLKNWLDAYLEYTRFSEAPDSFHLWTGIATVAGAMRRRTYLDMGYFKWYPNFFVVFVAPPGVVSKSTTADIGMRLLRQVEGIKFGPSSATWQSIVATLADMKEEYVTGGAGITATYESMSAMTVVASELGTFLSPDDRQSIDAYVHLWDCPTLYDKGTKLYGLESVENAWFQLLGCTTPTWVAENMSNYFIGGGFASRTIFIYNEAKRNLVAYPGRHIPTDHKASEHQLVADLRQIAELQGAFQLTDKAYSWGERWYEQHNTSDNPLRNDARLAGYFGRKQTHLHKTAMVHSAATRDDLLITAEDLEWADHEVTILERSMLRVFGEMNREEIVTITSQLFATVRARGRVRKDDLYKQVMINVGYDTYTKALEGLVGSGLVLFEQVGGISYLVLAEGVESFVASREQARLSSPPE